MLGTFSFHQRRPHPGASWFGLPNDNNLGLVRLGNFRRLPDRRPARAARSFGARSRCSRALHSPARAPGPHHVATCARLFWIYLRRCCSAPRSCSRFSRGRSGDLFGGANERDRRLFRSALCRWPWCRSDLCRGSAIFALASRRYPECFTLGGAAWPTRSALSRAAGEPQLMPELYVRRRHSSL